MTTRPDSYTQKLRSWCTQHSLDQPQWQDYSDPRGIRTAWSSGVIVRGVEYRATMWRDYRYLDQSREDAAEVAYKALTQPPPAQATSQPYQYAQTAYRAA